jgi:hypothetical protein
VILSAFRKLSLFATEEKGLFRPKTYSLNE